ncbi:hypothetical protein [uncultured Shewanella sp.]|uniref:hypothetical protein n=1 Tax=uncultured Shewanella sp. TaxID=173975 RepID=UPI00260AAF80|nr:hypothetical protein [uncultured Shewanella sp.]
MAKDSDGHKLPAGYTSDTSWGSYSGKSKALGMKVRTKALFSITQGAKCTLTFGADTTLVAGTKLLWKTLTWSKHAHLGLHFAIRAYVCSYTAEKKVTKYNNNQLALDELEVKAAKQISNIMRFESLAQKQTNIASKLSVINNRVNASSVKLNKVEASLSNIDSSIDTTLIDKKKIRIKLKNVTNQSRFVQQDTINSVNSLQSTVAEMTNSSAVCVNESKMIML